MTRPWDPLQWWADLIHRWDDRERSCDEDPRTEDAEPVVAEADLGPDPEPEPEPWQLRSVGAWVGWGTFSKASSAERDLKFAKGLGLGRLNVIVNDHSKSRYKRVFDTYDRPRLINFCRQARREGFEVHLMSWWMPHEAYIREGAEQLVELLEDSGAQSVELDAEEPWTQAREPMPWDEAAELTAEMLKGISFGVTGIGYTPSKKVGPLIARAQYMVPQCYSTARNKLEAETAAPRLVGRWRKLFGDRDLVVGLAGYRQKGRAGYSKERFMNAAFLGALSTEPTDIVYWSLRHLRTSRSTANVIRKLTQRASRRAE